MEWLKELVYSLTSEYEAGGVGKALLENMVVRPGFPPHELGCYVYTIPLVSKPAGGTVFELGPNVRNSRETSLTSDS